MSLGLSISAHSGPIQNVLWHWPTDWHLSFWVALPTTLLITELVKKLTALLVKPEKNVGYIPTQSQNAHFSGSLKAFHK